MWRNGLAAGVLVGLAACNGTAGGQTTDAPASWQDQELQTRCFTGLMSETGAGEPGAAPLPPDSAYIKLDQLGDLVTGIYSRFPGRAAPVTGSFTGTLEDGQITALHTEITAGDTIRTELVLRVENDGLRLGHGEQLLTEGILLFRDKGKLAFGPLMRATACR